MGAQKGKDLLLKMNDGTGFVTVAGLRSRKIAFNAETVDALCSVAGIKGQSAQNRLSSVRQLVDVPWGSAIDVFSNVSIPKYLHACHALPNFDELSPDCKGVLLSLVYNRGASFSQPGARYLEMRNIKVLMRARKFASIPAELRKMKRLWTTPSVRGVAIRREQEARLFESGLNVRVAA